MSPDICPSISYLFFSLTHPPRSLRHSYTKPCPAESGRPECGASVPERDREHSALYTSRIACTYTERAAKRNPLGPQVEQRTYLWTPIITEVHLGGATSSSGSDRAPALKLAVPRDQDTCKKNYPSVDQRPSKEKNIELRAASTSVIINNN